MKKFKFGDEVKVKDDDFFDGITGIVINYVPLAHKNGTPISYLVQLDGIEIWFEEEQLELLTLKVVPECVSTN